MAFDPVSFYISVAASYVLSRLSATNGPRLQNKEAAGGEYGIPMARGYGQAVRLTGAFIAQDDIKETKHKLGGNQTIIGGVIGLGAGLVGAAIGALFGAATQKHYYTYSDTFALFFLDRTDDDPIEGVTKLWANGKLIFKSSESTIVSETFDVDGKLIRRKYGKNKYFKSLTIYGGHTDQTVDPILDTTVNEDSAYIFSAYIVIEDLQLEPFGNSVPPCEGLVSVKTGETFAAAAEAICQAAGIDHERDVSTTALTSDVLRGYVITSEATCWDAIKPLLPVFAVDAAEVVGQIRFYKRAQTMRSTFVENDMGSYAYGDSPPEKFLFKRIPDLDLPQETSLTFVDPDRDYQPNTATSTRSEGSAKSNVNASISLVLSADEGASAAALMHWDAWLGRTQLSFSLTDGWINLATGLAYGVPIADQVVPYRITRRTRGANGIIEVEALSDESVTYTANVAGSSGIVPDDESTLFSDTRLVIMDMPITSDDHDDYGYYVAMGASEPSWTRGRIELSSDGVTFYTIVDEPEYAVMGDVTGTLAEGTTTGLDDTLDTTSVLTVVLLHNLMELESVTDDQLDNWENFCFVGKDGFGEYLQFKTATKVDTATWELTDLRRGRRGTDWAIGSHDSGEEFCLLGDGGVFRFYYPDTSEWGETFTLRGVTLHQDEADADEQTFTNTGEGKRPFSPVNVEGSWDGSYNLDITWDSRSRLFAGGLGIDDNAEWDIEITNATPVRSDTVLAETFTYSAADQVSDGLIAGQVVEGRVRQTSDVNDGRWRDFTLVGPLSRTADTTMFTADDDTITADMG